MASGDHEGSCARPSAQPPPRDRGRSRRPPWVSGRNDTAGRAAPEPERRPTIVVPWWSIDRRCLAKVAPWGGGNPGGALLELQRRLGPALLAEEVASLRPSRVLVTTGRWWFELFADHLGVDVRPASGLVEGIAEANGCRWVVVPHPQGKPRGLREDVVRALADG